MPAPFGLPAELAELQDDYELLGELGRGGAAVVYHARDRALGRDVAIKVVHPRPTSPNDDPVARLGREARTVAQLQHPNIVAVYAVRRLRGGGLALVMQCVPGATLKTVVQRDGPLPPEHCEAVLRDVATALAYAHARGIVHRDVKPENIFLDEKTGRALLADFGIARSADADSMTMTGTALGTPFYMSPEQVDGTPLDGRSDLYSLGLVAWEMLTGRRPWDGESLYNVIYKQRHEELPPIEALRPGVPPRLQYVVERMLQKRAAARWAGADGLLAQLNHAVLPGDYTRWQRALDARVARFRVDEERRREAARAGSAAPSGADGTGAPGELGLITAAASTVHFARPIKPEPAPGHAEPHDGSGAARGDVGPLALTRTVPLMVEPVSSGAWGDGVLPHPGTTVDLHPAPDTPLLAVASPTYRDVAEPTWDAALTGRGEPARPHVPRSRRWAFYTVPAVVMLSAGGALAFRARLDAAPTMGHAPARSLAAMAGGVPSRAPRSTAPHESRVRPPDVPASTSAPHRLILAAGGRHSCTATVAGSLYCWGANDRGQVGDGTAATRTTPMAVASVLTFESVVAGLAHSCALTRSGDVYCWGSDSRGQLGDATTVRRSAPVRVAGVGTYVSVAAGATHSCGVTSAGTVHCWGANDQGQLGDGTRTSRSVPTAIAFGSVATQVTAGGQHSCAVGESGEVRCWGANRDGQLGIGLQHATRETPSRVVLPSRAAMVSAGLTHTCALGTDGSAWCWGRNESGQLGDGTRTRRTTPTRVSSPDGERPFMQLVSGAGHNCALDRSGGVWCWGRSMPGAVGGGTALQRTVPTRVRLPAPAVAVAAGTAHSCATTTTSQTFCWGDNLDGQLGAASRGPRLTPTRVRYPPGVVPVTTNSFRISEAQ